MLDQSSNKPDGECMVLASAVHIAFKLFDHFLQLERFSNDCRKANTRVY